MGPCSKKHGWRHNKEREIAHEENENTGTNDGTGGEQHKGSGKENPVSHEKVKNEDPHHHHGHTNPNESDEDTIFDIKPLEGNPISNSDKTTGIFP